MSAAKNPALAALLLPLAAGVHAAQPPSPAAVPASPGTPSVATTAPPPRAAPVPLPPVRDRATRDALLARASTLRDARQFMPALRVYQHLLQADARDDVAYRMQALTLADLGASARAAELVRAWPQAFADHQREGLEGDEAARKVTWGATYPEREQDRFVEMQAALDAIDRLAIDAPRTTNWERTRLRIDRLAALNGLQRHEEVVAGYDALREEGVDLPAYAHAQAGDSLLALRRPERAAEALQRALALRADDVDARILLGYAWLEMERFDRAMPIFEELAAGQPAWPRAPGSRWGYENWDRYKADLNLAMARSFGHDHAGAQQLLGEMQRIGPYSAQTQTTYGSVLHRRERAAAALERHDMALTLDPRNRDASIGRVETLMDLQRMDAARVAHADLLQRFPEDRHVRRLDRNVGVRRGWRFHVGTSRGDNEPREGTAASPFGTRDGTRIIEAWTPLLSDRWRFGLVGEEAWAEFDAGTVRYRRAGVGVDYRHDRLGARLEAFDVLRDDAGPGAAARATVDWRASDAWRLRAGAAAHDIDASLQARRAGITADSAWVGATWLPSDLTRVDGQLKHLRYDDGNDRLQLGLDGRTRLSTAPHLLVDALASAWTSRGSRDDAPYFSPRRDASAALGVRLDHIAWRRYERHFRHRLDVMAGHYRQEDFGGAFVPSASYRHEWRFAPGSVLDYGVAWSRPVYDGNRERRLVFDIHYRWGF